MTNKVFINTEYITLGQLIKYENIVESGGYVKEFLMSSHIKVNGVIENRRGKKIYHGDIVEIIEYGTYEIVYNGH